MKVNGEGWLKDTNMTFGITRDLAGDERNTYAAYLTTDAMSVAKPRDTPGFWRVHVETLWELDSIVRMVEKYSGAQDLRDVGDRELMSIQGKPAVWIDPDEEGKDDNT